jgi:uncharacterized protein (DUF1778 family)
MPKRVPEGMRKRAINVRMTDDLREMVEVAATKNGRSITQECEARLLASFQPRADAAIPVEQLAEVMRATRETIRQEMRAEFEARRVDAPSDKGRFLNVFGAPARDYF